MQTRLFCLGVLLLLCGCGDPEPTLVPFDGSVTFVIEPQGGSDRPGLVSERTVTYLAVSKRGSTPLVDAWQDATPEGARYGRHAFPAGTSASAIAAYYGGVLANAGWKPDIDFRVGDASIHLFGIDSLRAGADRSQVRVRVRTGS